MADRPYVSHLTRDLERVFESNLNDKKVLNELKKELSFRSRPKAMKLKERVESRLAELKQGRHAIEQANLLEVSGVKLERSQRALFERRTWVAPRKQALSSRDKGRERLFADIRSPTKPKFQM